MDTLFVFIISAMLHTISFINIAELNERISILDHHNTDTKIEVVPEYYGGRGVK